MSFDFKTHGKYIYGYYEAPPLLIIIGLIVTLLSNGDKGVQG